MDVRNPFPAPRYDQAFLAWNTVGSYESHEDADVAVERLAAAGFPIEHLDIVGSDVRIVERVTGPMTRGKSALAGAARGLWTGLFVGLLLSFFATGTGFVLAVLLGMVIGATSGALFAVAGPATAVGKRGYASLRSMVPARFDLIARDGFADRARSILQPGGYVTA